jgi:predicted metal-dependent peptidase
MDYDKACNMAADDKGITTIVNELAAHGIPATAEQTGGFTMCAYIDLGEGWYIWAIAENACLYHGDDDREVEVVADLPNESPAEVAAHVAQFVRGWRGGLNPNRDSRRG